MAEYRSQYRWGAKAFLVSMEKGETRYDDGSFRWRSLQGIANRVGKEFGCKWVFRTRQGERFVTRTI